MIGAELQKAIWSALAESSPAVAGGRVYDQVPGDPTFPYVTIGDEQVLDDGNSCGDAWEVFSDIHVWSRPASGSKAEAKGIVADIVPLVVAIAGVENFDVVSAQLQNSRTVRDPDGLTEHAVLTFRFLLDPI